MLTNNFYYYLCHSDIIIMDVKMNEIKIGKYRHFKGNEYRVLYIARQSETLEEMVVYQALYGEMGIWVRPAQMWNEIIEKDGLSFRRFEYISE